MSYPPQGTHGFGLIPRGAVHKELRVDTSAAQDSITPSDGKKLIVYAMNVTMTVTAALTSTLRASVSFGTGGVTDQTKVLWAHRITAGDNAINAWIYGINAIGNPGETVTLTNVTFSAGTVITRVVIYYNEL